MAKILHARVYDRQTYGPGTTIVAKGRCHAGFLSLQLNGRLKNRLKLIC